MRLLTDAEIERFRRRCAEPAFSAAWSALERRAQAALEHGTDVPTAGGGWTHNYFCPDDATRLTFDRAQPRAHRCPACGRTFTGEPLDLAWISTRQNELVDGLRAAALAWLATRHQPYLDHVTTLLERYAALYESYPVHGVNAGKGRLMGQSLDESVWSIPASWAYDAVRDALPLDARERIEQGLFRPMAVHLHTQVMQRTHNIGCWILAGISTIAAVLQDESLLTPVFDPKWGIEQQLLEGTLEDGWWWEGSPAYHYYTITAILNLVTGLRLFRPEVTQLPRLRQMLDTPPAIARADLSQPALNDCWYMESEPGALARRAPLYEIAHGLWGDDSHAALLGTFYGSGVERTSLEALLFGPDTLPAAPATAQPTASAILQSPSGYAVFRRPEHDAWLLFKFGPHGGGHGHPDKLALDYHAFGQRLSADLGTPGYGIPLNRIWYRHTLAHNTVLLDGESQPPATGELLHFADGSAGGYATAHARVSWPDNAPAPYAGVTLERSFRWAVTGTPRFWEEVRVECPEPRLIELAWHHAGAIQIEGASPVTELPAQEGALPFPPPLPENPTYALLAELRHLRAPANAWTATWRLGDEGSGPGTRCQAIDPPGAA
ncbi:MAG TPA: heparinase II/III family protein, partial [Chloroflexota bacterium]|nr:heparinase II/III family protein [Chloroflexota bacterium]